MNPYWNSGFFEFFGILFSRIVSFFSGAGMELAPDEVQLATLAAVAVSCGLLGPFLVLKRMTMFANSISHTVLLGIVLAFFLASKLWGGEMFSLPNLMLGSAAAALLTAFFTEGLTRFFRLAEDASVGLVFSSLFALGILLVTLFTKDVHLSVEAILGNPDALQPSDFGFAGGLAAASGLFILLFYRHLKISSFDSQYASVSGVPAGLLHLLLLLLSSAALVGAFRAVGVLLVLAFLVGPYLSARLFCNRLSRLLAWSPALGIAASLIGVALSRHLLSVYGLPLSTGGIVVCVIGIFYAAALFIKSFIYAKLPTCRKGSPS